MKKLLWAGAACMLAACGQAPEKTETAETNTTSTQVASIPQYSAQAFFNTTSYALAGSTDYTFNQDGSRVLISSDKSGVFNVYALAVDGTGAEQLTSSEGPATFAIGYFPNDDRYFYTFDGGGDELNKIWAAGPGLEEAVNLTPGEKTKAGFAGWSDDGETLYLTTNERDPRAFDLYAYNVADFSRALVFQNDDALQIGGMSPDGQWLALTKNDTSANSDVYLHRMGSSSAPTLITAHEGNIAYGATGSHPIATS